jgi:hypothetical protein
VPPYLHVRVCRSRGAGCAPRARSRAYLLKRSAGLTQTCPRGRNTDGLQCLCVRNVRYKAAAINCAGPAWSAMTSNPSSMACSMDRAGPLPHQYRANRVMMPKAHRFSRSSYCASRRLYVAQRMRGGFGGKSYSSSVVPPHLSCRRLAILRARFEAR